MNRNTPRGPEIFESDAEPSPDPIHQTRVLFVRGFNRIEMGWWTEDSMFRLRLIGIHSGGGLSNNCVYKLDNNLGVKARTRVMAA